MNSSVRRELFERWKELGIQEIFNVWLIKLYTRVSCISVDSKGRRTEGIYSPDEKFNNVMLYRDHITK